MQALERIEALTWLRWAPPPRLTVSEWSDRYRVLPSESSAEPGRWRTSRTPYLRAVMDALSDRHIHTVVLMASSQIGKTECLLNSIGYYMHLDPGPMMLIEPTLDMASAVSKDRIGPMLRDTPVLTGLVGRARSRDASATTFHKSFPGGHLTLAGANSPASLSSRPIRFLWVDEADRAAESVGAGRTAASVSRSEGDPIALAVKRTTTFRRRKIVIVSSPTVKDASRIEDWYSISDQRRYFVPCPRCSGFFVMEWEHIRWMEGDPSTAHLECPLCHGTIEDRERHGMVSRGEWRASKPFAGVAGFHVWEILAPWRTLTEQVGAFLIAKRSLETRQAWTNTSLGKVWEAPGEKIEPSSLLLRREVYPADMPSLVKVITVGIDTQDDRLEAMVVGWGPGEEAWVIAHEMLAGDPSGADVWAQLDELLETDWTDEEGSGMRIAAGLIDAGGHRTQAVYSAVIARQGRGLQVSFGRSGGENGLLVSPAKAIRPKNGTGSVPRRIIDSDQLKALTFARLKVSEVGSEYIHFPMTVGETFFEGLTAEKLITKRNKYGVPSKQWEQVRERNEQLDCFCMALAALRAHAPNAKKFEELAAKVERRAKAMKVPSDAPKPPQAPAQRWVQPRPGWLRGR